MSKKPISHRTGKLARRTTERMDNFMPQLGDDMAQGA
jgi:hypothetical protein